MESKPSIIEKWKYFLLGTLLGFIILFFYYDHVHQDLYIIATKNSMIDLTPFKVLNSSNNTTIEPPNLTFNDTYKAPKKATRSNGTYKGQEKDTIRRKKCNIFDGRWVYKPEVTSRYYNEFNCPLISDKTKCQSNGRPDSKYEKWIWEARDCELPLFNGTFMLEQLRNKRMILVGDSLNHNMWQSLVCLLSTSIPSPDKPRGYTWKSKDHNFTLQFVWSNFLTEVYTNHEISKKVLVVDKISSNAHKWLGADIMVFNSGHWWKLHGKPQAWELYEFKGKIIKDMRIELAYKRGLKTWAKWIKSNVDPRKTSVFFRSYSPVHRFSKYNQWCYKKTQPIMDDSYVPDFSKSMFDVVKTVLKGMSNVNYLNITKLSEYRIDAHPSLYTTKYDHNPKNYADCSHWCLPGVPDTWNKLLYTSIFFDILANEPI